MKNNQHNHHRHSLRLKDYDYSTPGMYFITICTRDKTCIFGDIIDGCIVLNHAGNMVSERWIRLSDKFKNICIDNYVIMPNHIHGIISIKNNNVGAGPRACPDERHSDNMKIGFNTLGSHTGLPLHKIIGWFKTMTTNIYIHNVRQNNWQRFNKRLWQRNYYEHIIRNEYELNEIREYIINNPIKWELDNENPCCRSRPACLP